MDARRNDSVIRISKWLDKKIKRYIQKRKNKIEFPSKRNFVDKAVLNLLKKKGEIR